MIVECKYHRVSHSNCLIKLSDILLVRGEVIIIIYLIAYEQGKYRNIFVYLWNV